MALMPERQRRSRKSEGGDLDDVGNGQLPRTYTGIVDAYREIIPTLVRQAQDGRLNKRRKSTTPVNGEGRDGRVRQHHRR